MKNGVESLVFFLLLFLKTLWLTHSYPLSEFKIPYMAFIIAIL
jgi:hypothetical protein